jgi:hypothetical protein
MKEAKVEAEKTIAEFRNEQEAIYQSAINHVSKFPLPKLYKCTNLTV